MVKRPYLLRVLIALDDLVNALIFNGDPQETMSSRLGKKMLKGSKFAGFV